MTVLVAVHDRAGGWAVAADSTTWDGPIVMAPLPPGTEKARRRDDGLVVATTGDVALSQLLDRVLDKTTDDRLTDRWAQRVACRWTELAHAGHYVKDDEFHGEAFIAAGDRLWDLSENLAMPLAAWATAGAGREIAAGAVAVLSRMDMTAVDIAQRAVEAAISLHQHCAGHALVFSTRP